MQMSSDKTCPVYHINILVTCTGSRLIEPGIDPGKATTMHALAGVDLARLHPNSVCAHHTQPPQQCALSLHTRTSTGSSVGSSLIVARVRFSAWAVALSPHPCRELLAQNGCVWPQPTLRRNGCKDEQSFHQGLMESTIDVAGIRHLLSTRKSAID